MEILKFTDDHTAYRERLAAFLGQEVVPLITPCEADHLTPKSMWQAMGKNGFLCPWVPKEYGGQGLDFLYSVIVWDEVAKINFTGLAVGLHSDIVVPYVHSFGSEAQKQAYLPGCVSGDIITAVAMTEPGAGSDVAAMETTATLDGDEIILSYNGNHNIAVDIEGMLVTLTPDENWNGQESFNMGAADSLGALVFDELDVIVNPQNDSPSINLPNLPYMFELDEDSSIEIDLSEYIYDIDGDDLLINITGNDSINYYLNDFELYLFARYKSLHHLWVCPVCL